MSNSKTKTILPEMAVHAPRKGKKVKFEKERDIARSDFIFFVENYMWPFDFGTLPITQWHKKRLREIEDSIVSQTKRTLDLWFRGGFKSTFISRYSNMWEYLRDPEITILIRHGDATKAEGIVSKMQRHHRHNKAFRAIFPEFCPESGQKWGTMDEFRLPNAEQHTAEPTVRARGIEANLTGDHYRKVQDDDPENEINVNTADTRFKLIRKWEDTTSILTRLPIYDGRHSMVGTPWHAAGLWLGHVIPKFGPESDAPARSRIVYREYPACDSKLKPNAPEILTHDDLVELLHDQGPYKFSANYLLRPTDPDTATFKNEWIQYQPYPSERHNSTDKGWLDYCTVKRCLSIDLAESSHRDADYLAYVLVDIDDAGRWFFRRAYKRRQDVLSFIHHLFELHEKWAFDAVYVDANTTQIYFSKWVSKEAHQKGISLPLIPVKRGDLGQRTKDLRIKACQPRWHRGDCFIVEHAPGATDLVYDMINYPAIGHDDLLDAMAQLELMEGRGESREKTPIPVGSLSYWQEETRPRPEPGSMDFWQDPDAIRRIRRRYGDQYDQLIV
jgi:predicted phage terminase large subunit-like protein